MALNDNNFKSLKYQTFWGTLFDGTTIKRSFICLIYLVAKEVSPLK